ncbi:MAG: PAS domain-containing protein [Alphaproteobacteria bacterium]|nr:MAG: PAS domain-containing protein [Alphaproteobacteria bacterium]
MGEILGALPDPVLLLDADDFIKFANSAAEQFLGASAAVLRNRRLSEIVAAGSPLLALIAQARRRHASFAEYGVDIALADARQHAVDAHVAILPDRESYILVTLQLRSIADTISRQMTHRGAARSVAGVAAMLAHEIKNPLSGIRGAAQLLEDSVKEEERSLTRLICKEADRIVALVDQMDMFSDNRPPKRQPENIHKILDHVLGLARAGFAKHLAISARYDPSLPPVDGNWDQLVQVFLNLVKNAAEAAPRDGGEIVLTTGYRHGVRVAVSGSRQRLNLPIEVCVIDNGDGVPEDMQPYLFDPFVTSKPNGKGLGLALAAKLIGDHGGIIDCDSRPRRTIFRVLLPAAEA